MAYKAAFGQAGHGQAMEHRHIPAELGPGHQPCITVPLRREMAKTQERNDEKLNSSGPEDVTDLLLCSS